MVIELQAVECSAITGGGVADLKQLFNVICQEMLKEWGMLLDIATASALGSLAKELAKRRGHDAEHPALWILTAVVGYGVIPIISEHVGRYGQHANATSGG